MSDLPRVLLLGDSIRMSYQARVTELLRGEAEVVGPSENCRFSLYTQSRLATWLQELGTPQIVHWNNGLWDCGHNISRGPEQFSISDYVQNLRTVLRDLRATGATIVWATCTPQHPTRSVPKHEWWWKNEEIDAYNAAALELMIGEGIPVNDLNALIKSDYESAFVEDKIHLSPAGVERCAEAVARAVRRAMPAAKAAGAKS